MVKHYFLLLVCATAQLVLGAESFIWDGQKTVNQYAHLVNLLPEKVLDLGNNVKLEAVLVPASKFVMGTPDRDNLNVPKAVAWISGIIFVLLIQRWWMTTRRLQFSLAFLVRITLVAAVGLWGYVRCNQIDKQWDNSNEHPAHEVTLTKPFYMGKYHVTMDQYQQIMGAMPTGYSYQGKGLYPVWGVSWDDAKIFCKKLSEKTGEAVRLPSEAEWEHACRAGSTTNFYSGDSDDDFNRVGWNNLYQSETGEYTFTMEIHTVGLKEPNRFGLYDMHGNVWQWCNDRYGPYSSKNITDPQGFEASTDHVLRGGSIGCTPGFCRAAYRTNKAHVFVGFRVVIDAVRAMGVEK